MASSLTSVRLPMADAWRNRPRAADARLPGAAIAC